MKSQHGHDNLPARIRRGHSQDCPECRYTGKKLMDHLERKHPGVRERYERTQRGVWVLTDEGEDEEATKEDDEDGVREGVERLREELQEKERRVAELEARLEEKEERIEELRETRDRLMESLGNRLSESASESTSKSSSSSPSPSRKL